MNKKVLAISFKNANYNRSSVCSINIALFKDKEIKINKEILINPQTEFEQKHIDEHGINEESIKDSNIFKYAWNEVQELIDEDTLVISSNAGLDISVLRHVCDKYNIIYPSFEYLCISKLNNIIYDDCSKIKLNCAYDCLKYYINILSNSKYKNIDDLLVQFNIEKGILSSDSYKPFGIKKYSHRREYNINELKLRNYDFENYHPFYSKNIVFTGTLQSMRRAEAMKKVNSVGGIYSNSVSKNTNYLVIGMQSLAKFNGKNKSSKMISAQRLISQGTNLKVIYEDQFLDML